MLSHGIHELLRHSDQAARLRTGPEFDESAVGRSAALSGANHDPAQFPEPETFDIARRPNRHLPFGLGIHICAGNPLASIEGSIAFGKLFRRFPGLRLEAPAKLSRRIRFREIKELRVAI